MERVVWKFPNRRKAESFSVYPEQNGEVVIQSSKTIAQINLKTGKGILNAKGSNGKYFMHLNELLGAERYTFKSKLIAMIKSNTPKSGDEIGGGVYFA